MADLHRFQDQAKTPEGRKRPIKAQDLDENFTWCRAEIGDSLSPLIKRTKNAPAADKLELSVPPTGTFFPYIKDGVFILLPIPSGGQYYVKFVNGVPTTIERGTCEE